MAGKRKGFGDTRGTLFFDVVRIAKEKQPKAILLENVKGLVGHDKGNTLNVMIQSLCEANYVVDFEVLNSKFFGVPQNRERIFIIAIREDLIEQEDWVISGSTVVPKGKKRIQDLEGVKTFNFDFPRGDGKVVKKLKDVLEDEVDEKYYLDDEKTSKLVAQLEDKDLTEGTIGHHPFSKKLEFNGYKSEVSPSLVATDYKAPKTVLEKDVPKWIPTPEEINRTVRSSGKSSLSEKHNHDYIAQEVRPVLTPERLNKRQQGRRFKDDGEEAFTLNTQDRHGVLLGMCIDDTQGFDGIRTYQDETPTIRSERYGLKTVTKKYRIRKLTPKECWRLQGFPDELFDKVKEAGLSDSQLYRQSGNAVTVNVIEAIGERLLKYI